ENFKLLKRQKDFYTKEAEGHQAARTELALEADQRRLKEEQVAKLMRDYNELLDNGKFEDAKMTAMKAHELDPDNPITQAALRVATIESNQREWDGIRERQAEHRIKDINDSFDPGPVVTDRDPLHFDPESMERGRGRSARMGSL